MVDGHLIHYPSTVYIVSWQACVCHYMYIIDADLELYIHASTCMGWYVIYIMMTITGTTGSTSQKTQNTQITYSYSSDDDNSKLDKLERPFWEYPPQ